jgi:hypothetical protein
MVGNHASSVWVHESLTARPTSRAGTKVGPSDPVVESGIAIAHRTKGTPSHPGAGEGPKGPAVRRLKRYASWVQNVVRQFGPYPLWAQEM